MTFEVQPDVLLLTQLAYPLNIVALTTLRGPGGREYDQRDAALVQILFDLLLQK